MAAELELAAYKSLTLQQRAFVDYVSEGFEISRAVELAGYSDIRPDSEAWRLMRQPAIIAAIHLETARKLALAAPVALKALIEFAGDAAIDKRIRLAAAKTLLDRAGHIAPKALAPSKAGEKPLNELSTGELRELADKLERELSDRAKPVISADPAPKPAQAIEDIM
jgi:hypothetical protein